MQRESSPCAICHGDIRHGGAGAGDGGCGAGGGQNVFTADCSHQFHSRCVSGSVSRGGRLVCPVCNTRWAREPPSLRFKSPPPPSPPQLEHAAPVSDRPFFRPMEPRVFDDDDPVLRPPQAQHHCRHGGGNAAPDGSAVVLRTHCEYSALPRDAACDNFAVVVHARAPGDGGAAAAAASRGARLDLVTVLDVSGSMVGSKLALLKQAMGFVVDNLGPGDRLCVVSFSSRSSRLMRLARMSDGGKALARRAVESLAAAGGTNIDDALRKAAKVLDDRLYQNAAASVILLSDGQDTYTVPGRGGGRGADYNALVPPSFVFTGAGGRSTVPVHTFGFGTDHDAAAMHTIAEATGGTFSFIENVAAIQDAFAQCIGGLLSVAVQELRVDVACVHAGVRVRTVKSGRYESRIDGDGRTATIDVGELYADEERHFLLFVDVPRARATDDATHLVETSCAYRDMESGRTTAVDGEDAVVLRPSRLAAASAERSGEVERELVRVEAMDDIAAARAAAERGAHAEAVEILHNRQRAVARSAAARSGDSMCLVLSVELREMRSLVADRRRYELSGRAFVLAGLSSHAQQRATSRQMSGESAASGRAASERGMSTAATASYVTPAMLDMLHRSRRSRERRRSGNC